jgi:predicted dehydrogenase
MASVLIVGYGSIGARHARVAAALGLDVAFVTQRDDAPGRVFRGVHEAAGLEPDLVVIANETSRHAATLAVVANAFRRAKILVEKPLFAADAELPASTAGRAWVGYNLRFHPAIQRLVDELEGRPLFSLRATVGQHLATWRPSTDYRASYSARAGEGGALRDLSHELDLVDVIAGPWTRVAALVGHRSDLETAADDVADLLVVSARCPSVGVHVDVVDRAPRRTLVAHAAGRTVEADLIAGTVAVNGESHAARAERDDTYTAQMRAVLDGDARWLCPLEVGRRTVRLIEAAERAASTLTWVQA